MFVILYLCVAVYRERFMSYINQLTAPGHKPLHLGKTVQEVKEEN